MSQSPEPHEAAAALRQAQKLMEIHGISQANLVAADVGQTEVKSMVSVSRVKSWELGLIQMVAKAFGCQLMWTSSHSEAADVFGRYVIIGLKTQIPLAQYTCQVMQRRLLKARAAYVASLNEELGYEPSRSRKTSAADGFCVGWVHAVEKTVHEFALEPSTKQLIRDIIDQKCGGKKAKLKNSNIDHDSVEHGFRAGAGESIQRPVGQQKNLFLS